MSRCRVIVELLCIRRPANITDRARHADEAEEELHICWLIEFLPSIDRLTGSWILETNRRCIAMTLSENGLSSSFARRESAPEWGLARIVDDGGRPQTIPFVSKQQIALWRRRAGDFLLHHI